MSLLVAVPAAVAAGLAYGAATAVQHAAAHTGEGTADAGRLLALLRDPRWLLSVGGDGIGLGLQVLALATGPVALVQPLLVLAVPVSLPVGWALGGPRPTRADLVSCAAVVVGLAAFVLLVGDPGPSRGLAPSTALVLATVGLLAGGACCLVVRGRAAAVRALGYGTVAGGWFGLVGVLLDAASGAVGRHGATSAEVLVPAVGVLAVGAGALVLTQVAFQVGALAASFPASESAAPVVAVVLAGTLLGERVPHGAADLLGYAGCLTLVVAGTLRLARGRQAAGVPGG